MAKAAGKKKAPVKRAAKAVKRAAGSAKEAGVGGVPRFLLWFGAGFAGLLLCLFLIAALLFSPLPELSPAPLSADDIAYQNELLMRITKEVFQGEPEESELILTPEKLDSLHRIADNGFALTSLFLSTSALPPRYYGATLREGALDLTVPVVTPLRWLFGGIIRLSMTVVPEKDGEWIDLEFRRFRLGSIPLPAWLVEQFAASELRKRRNDPQFRKFDRAVKSLYIGSDGALHILYRPAELRGAILRF